MFGNIIKAVTAPVTSVVKAVENVAKGDVGSAINNVSGGVMQNTPIHQAINASPDLKEYFRNDKGLNNMLLGLPKDAVKATDAYNRLSGGGSLTSSEWGDVAVFSGKGAAMVGAAAYGGSSAASWAAENPTQALITAKLMSEGKYAQVANNFGVPVPSGVGTISPPPAGVRPTPVSSGPLGGGPAIDSYSIEALDLKTKIALGVALFFFVGLIFKKMRS